MIRLYFMQYSLTEFIGWHQQHSLVDRVLKYVPKLYAVIVKCDQYFQKHQLITKIFFIFVLGMDSRVFQRSSFKQIEDYQSEKEDEKGRSFQKFLRERKLTPVPSPEIVPNPKIPTPSSGDAWLVFKSNKKFIAITKNMHATEVCASYQTYLW